MQGEGYCWAVASARHTEAQGKHRRCLSQPCHESGAAPSPPALPAREGSLHLLVPVLPAEAPAGRGDHPAEAPLPQHEVSAAPRLRLRHRHRHRRSRRPLRRHLEAPPRGREQHGGGADLRPGGVGASAGLWLRGAVSAVRLCGSFFVLLTGAAGHRRFPPACSQRH